VTRFIKELQATGDWTEAEIIEVQTRIIRVLLKAMEDCE
jgi:hypothetical protein